MQNNDTDTVLIKELKQLRLRDKVHSSESLTVHLEFAVQGAVWNWPHVHGLYAWWNISH